MSRFLKLIETAELSSHVLSKLLWLQPSIIITCKTECYFWVGTQSKLQWFQPSAFSLGVWLVVDVMIHFESLGDLFFCIVLLIVRVAISLNSVVWQKRIYSNSMRGYVKIYLNLKVSTSSLLLFLQCLDVAWWKPYWLPPNINVRMSFTLYP